MIREAYREIEYSETYLPPLPDDMLGLLDDILDAARDLQLQSELEDSDVSQHLVNLTAALCGSTVPAAATPMDQLADLLIENACIVQLGELFTQPRTWDEVLPDWRGLGGGRQAADDDVLIAEMLAYLTLGALVQVDGDPLLRPKLHFFVQGLQGLGIVFSENHEPEIAFEENREDVMPLLLCRSCGQHYSRLIAFEWQSSNDSQFGFREARVPSHFEEPDDNEGSGWLYLTSHFHTESEEDEDSGQWQTLYLCPVCHTAHEKHEPRCLNQNANRPRKP